jgi:RNA polymerase sigma-70 factor (ECF subfamily)
MESDRELLDRWAEGDESSGRALYRRYCDAITDFFSRKAANDAADLVQRTFLKCLEARRGGTIVEHPRAFLYTIARRELFDGFAKRRDFDPAVTSLHDLATGPASRVARDQEIRLLLEAMQRVPIDQQIALELYYWDALPMAEVAAVLGITKSAAINRVHRARSQIRAVLLQLGASPDAADRATRFERRD